MISEDEARKVHTDIGAAHAADYERLGRFRGLARQCREAATELDGQRGAASLIDAAEVLEADCAATVRRWD